MPRLNEIHIRDPFVYPDPIDRTYYMFGTTGRTAWEGKPEGFDVYASKDLLDWEGPYPAFRPHADFWSDQDYWAPEVHHYKGKYYMLASFKAANKSRATQILVADLPTGPYVPLGDKPITPMDWECLDGTLYVDNLHQPWMIFCHEWLQVDDGEICAVPLKDDLSGAADEPALLIRASQAPWACPTKSGYQFVTDGPFIYETEDRLLMIWSSFGKSGYAIGICRSQSGTISGPWEHLPEPLFERDGGHGMIFKTFDGELLLALHVPNVHPMERPAFFTIRDAGDTLEMIGVLSTKELRRCT